MARLPKWNGTKVIKKMERASMLGVNETMGDAALIAKTNHEFQNRSGLLEGSVQIIDAAKKVAGAILGTWGSKNVIYAIFIELGWVNLGEGLPFLRPAAAVSYRDLPNNIRKAYARLGVIR